MISQVNNGLMLRASPIETGSSLASLFSTKAGGALLSSWLVPSSSWLNRGAESTGVANRTAPTVSLSAPGSRRFESAGHETEIADTGIKVKVTDLVLQSGESAVQTGAAKYLLPTYVKSGFALITGTGADDKISVAQDRNGDSIVEVEKQGRRHSLNIGRIAALTVRSGDGADSVSIDVSRYFGGITVESGAGNDAISVNSYQSLLRGVKVQAGDGKDSIVLAGQLNKWAIEAGAGNDTVDASAAGNEPELGASFAGDAGDDLIMGTKGNDLIDGGAGSDLLVGNDGADLIKGGEGADVVYAGVGNDNVNGGDGADVLYGGVGSDIIYGSDGDDIIMGEQGGDLIYGGNGNDQMYGGSSGDEITGMFSGGIQTSGTFNVLQGGTGSDVFLPSSTRATHISAYTGSGSYVVDYEDGVDTLI